ncbi:Adaptive-response sensory-kinase SasA [Comamonas sp. PE63]|uniref:histidine kinase n=1 Tax=Comamonas brasiliensis TaxID=1812482 RepID=A0ABS5LP11_9BURK|nr:ATP-binding protein [Comamonas sp. PE63]MBS3018107.1 Adaptive-response sensory-kinase SasA [Comamonas sp. PE63]
MRWLPRSISGQLLALWIVAILVAHLIAVLALSWWRSDNIAIHPLSARTIETRIQAAYKAASHDQPVNQLLEDISLPESEFRLFTAPRVKGEDSRWSRQELALEQAIRARLELAPETPLHVRLLNVLPGVSGQVDRRNWIEKAFRSRHALAMDVEVLLPGGQWLYSRHWPTPVPAHWSRVLSFSLLVGTIPAAIIALLFGRQIMRPLAELTEASRRVSRGERVVLPQPGGLSGVRDIVQAFNDMQDSLVRFVNGRTQMLAAMGHDLRTPLTSLRIRAEFIEDEALRNAMIATLDDMSAMVSETLRFARDEAHQEPTQEVAIDALIQQVIDAQSNSGKSVRPTLRLDTGLHYRCRPVNLKRALHNIIDNAARYGEVRVAAMLDDSRRVLRIAVDDDGPGIPPAQLEHVFEPFTRLDAARSTHSGGVGLGLAIARSSIRAHGGDVTLHNRVEGGLRALIEMPV